MGIIKITDGNFPPQKAILISKTGMFKKTAIAVRPAGGLAARYNVRNAVKAVEIIHPDKKSPTVKIVLFDDRVIVAIIGKRDFSELTEAVVQGPDGSGDMFVSVFSKNKEQPDTIPTLWGLGILGAFIMIMVNVLPLFFKPPMTSSAIQPNIPVEASALTLDKASSTALAQTLCHEQIKKEARSPKSLDFPWGGQVDILDGKNILLTSYFDAQNAFGAEIRTHYLCQITMTGSNPSSVYDWSLKEIVYQ